MRVRRPGGRVTRRAGSRWSGACRVLVGDVGDGDGFVAVWAQPAEVDAGSWAVAVVAPLLAEGSVVAFGALVDGDGAAGGALQSGPDVGPGVRLSHWGNGWRLMAGRGVRGGRVMRGVGPGGGWRARQA